MSRPLDEMEFTVTRRPGAWDGPWVPLVPVLATPVDGDPTPFYKAAVNDVGAFVAGEWAQFYDAAGAILDIVQIVSIASLVLKFATDALTFDAAAGDAVMPALLFKASRPQPVGPEAIDFLEEGARTTARYVIYAHGDQPVLYSTRDGYAADTVVYDGKTYMITTDDSYQDMPLGYRAYILLEYGADERIPTP